MVDIQSAAAEVRRGKKIEEERNHRKKYNGLLHITWPIIACPITYGGNNNRRLD